jgi:hypothetical protein
MSTSDASKKTGLQDRYAPYLVEKSTTWKRNQEGDVEKETYKNDAPEKPETPGTFGNSENPGKSGSG